MQTIQCPKCGEVFSVDESGYAAIVKQVRDREFSAEIAQREDAMRREKENAVALAKAETAAQRDQKISALEGALKLKEISYIHAEAYAAGELKHGTLALIVSGVPVIVLATQMDVYDKTVSNLQEVKAREAVVIAIGFEGDTSLEKYADHVIYIPQTDKYLAPLMAVLPLQLLAYYAALTRGCDVDKPRNLAKSVTVE